MQIMAKDTGIPFSVDRHTIHSVNYFMRKIKISTRAEKIKEQCTKTLESTYLNVNPTLSSLFMKTVDHIPLVNTSALESGDLNHSVIYDPHFSYEETFLLANTLN